MAAYSPVEEWRKSAFKAFFDIGEYWKQRRRVLAEPDLIFADPHEALKIKPLAFAVRGLVLLAAVFALMNWLASTFLALPPTADERLIANSKMLEEKIKSKQDLSIQEYLEASRTPASKNLDRIKKIQAFAETIRALLIPIALTMTAYLFKRFLNKYADLAPEVGDADRAYLYWITSKLFFPNLVAAVAFESTTLRSRFMDAELAQFSTLWILVVCGLWGLIALRLSAPALAKILAITHTLGSQKALRAVANRLVAATALTNIALQVLFTGVLVGYSLLLGRGDA